MKGQSTWRVGYFFSHCLFLPLSLSLSLFLSLSLPLPPPLFLSLPLPLSLSLPLFLSHRNNVKAILKQRRRKAIARAQWEAAQSLRIDSPGLKSVVKRFDRCCGMLHSKCHSPSYDMRRNKLRFKNWELRNENKKKVRRIENKVVPRNNFEQS